MTAQPTVDRPVVPEGYGLPDTAEGVLDWAQVEAELVAARTYWLASVRADGTPHVVPRWGVWLAGRFYYDGSPETVHARNAQRNPAVTLHLESGTRAVIVDGDSVPTRADPDVLGAELAAAFGKYHELGYQPGPQSWAGADGGGLRVLSPRRVLAWFSFPTDCTRFRFAG